MGTVKLRIGQLILFKDGKEYNLDVVKEKKNQESIENQAKPAQTTQPAQSTTPTQ